MSMCMYLCSFGWLHGVNSLYGVGIYAQQNDIRRAAETPTRFRYNMGRRGAFSTASPGLNCLARGQCRNLKCARRRDPSIGAANRRLSLAEEALGPRRPKRAFLVLESGLAP